MRQCQLPCRWCWKLIQILIQEGQAENTNRNNRNSDSVSLYVDRYSKTFGLTKISVVFSYVQGPLNNFFFLENALKKLLNIFPNFFFYLKVQSFRLIMENNFIPMAALASHVVVYTIGPIFQNIIDCVQLYFPNGFTNIVL